ncbi:MAG: 4-amino-4-deoxy-L-arabinose transferase and related glycosyltransferase of family, partial [Acidobacteria bacterium]|nr:4-amino-4-deoxy-L-arabinose transferase and related glycosyltransferase of family [Acidobacteriota bacterium]
LYIPEQLRHGTLLYRDVHYFYPPLAPCVLALITAVTGSSLAAYAAIGITIALLTAGFLYLLVRSTAGARAAFAATLLFVACSMTGASSFGCNWIFPYSHAATIGMMLVVAGTAALFAGRPMLASLLLALAATAKIETFVIGAAVVVAGMAGGRLRAPAVLLYAGCLAAVAATIQLVFGAAGWANIFPPSLLAGDAARHFYAHVSGLSDWRGNLARSAPAALLVAALAASLALLERARGGRLRVALPAIAALLLALAIADDRFFRAWMLLQVALVPFALARRREPLPVLLAFSLASTSRVFFNLTPAWYGFLFVVPLYALIAYVLVEWLPSRGVYSRRLAGVWLLPIALLAGRTALAQIEAWDVKQHRVVTLRGTFYDASPDRAAILNDALPLLATSRSLVVMPEGLTLNYFAGVPNPLSFYIFTPPEIDTTAERAIVAELRSRKPERIALVTRSVAEFGSRGFGIDYGRQIVATLREQYEIEREWHAPRFALVVLRIRRHLDDLR